MSYSSPAVILGTGSLASGVSLAVQNSAGTTMLYNSDFVPDTDGTGNVGSSGQRWNTIYATTGTINTSDERMKQDIQPAPLGLDFIKRLLPRVFRWRTTSDTQAQEAAEAKYDADALKAECKPYEQAIEQVRAQQASGELSDEEGNKSVDLIRATLNEIRDRHLSPVQEARKAKRPGRRLHYGLIAQEVKAALDDAGVDSMDAGFWQENPSGMQSLAYSQLIVPLIGAVQELSARVEALEAG